MEDSEKLNQTATPSPTESGTDGMPVSGLVKWAEAELARLEDTVEEGNEQGLEIQKFANKCILDLIKVFSDQNHSGSSGPYVSEYFHRLANWYPVTPLTGDEDEWLEVYPGSEDDTQHNKRYQGLFRTNHDNTTAYDINAVVFSSDGGFTWFTNGSLRKKYSKPIEFPYLPDMEPRRVFLKEVNGVFEDITDNEGAKRELYEAAVKDFEDYRKSRRNRT